MRDFQGNPLHAPIQPPLPPFSSQGNHVDVRHALIECLDDESFVLKDLDTAQVRTALASPPSCASKTFHTYFPTNRALLSTTAAYTVQPSDWPLATKFALATSVRPTNSLWSPVLR